MVSRKGLWARRSQPGACRRRGVEADRRRATIARVLDCPQRRPRRAGVPGGCVRTAARGTLRSVSRESQLRAPRSGCPQAHSTQLTFAGASSVTLSTILRVKTRAIRRGYGCASRGRAHGSPLHLPRLRDEVVHSAQPARARVSDDVCGLRRDVGWVGADVSGSGSQRGAPAERRPTSTRPACWGVARRRLRYESTVPGTSVRPRRQQQARAE